MWGHTQILGPVGSAVLTFIGYRQIDRQTKYLHRILIGYYFPSEFKKTWNQGFVYLLRHLEWFYQIFHRIHPPGFIFYCFHWWKNLNYISAVTYRIISSGRNNLTQGQPGTLPPTSFRISFKGSDRLCKVAELSMQCCGKPLSDSFETY